MFKQTNSLTNLFKLFIGSEGSSNEVLNLVILAGLSWQIAVFLPLPLLELSQHLLRQSSGRATFEEANVEQVKAATAKQEQEDPGHSLEPQVKTKNPHLHAVHHVDVTKTQLQTNSG